MLNSELHRKFIRALMDVPSTDTSDGRTSLLAGLPPNVKASLPRSDAAHTDLSNIITGLDHLGCTESPLRATFF